MKVTEVKNVQSKPNPHGVDARSISEQKAPRWYISPCSRVRP